MRGLIRFIALIPVLAFTNQSSLMAGCPCEGNVNGSVNIDAVDLDITLDCIDGDCAACTNDCDVNCDGEVDHVDFGVVECQFEGRSDCCDLPAGACDGVDNLALPTCMDTLEVACDRFEGTWHGRLSICQVDGVLAVPAANTWGLIALMLAMLSAGSVIVQRRRSVSEAH